MKFQNRARVCTHNLLYLLQAKAKFHPSEKSDFPFKLYAREEMKRFQGALLSITDVEDAILG